MGLVPRRQRPPLDARAGPRLSSTTGSGSPCALRAARYSLPAALSRGLQIGLPAAAFVAATTPVFGMSWFFDTENWAAGSRPMSSGNFEFRPGLGSNLVVSDAGFHGLVIRLGAGFGGVGIDGIDVPAGGAAPLPSVARTSVDAGLTRIRVLRRGPRSAGSGAIRQNAGRSGAENSEDGGPRPRPSTSTGTVELGPTSSRCRTATPM